MTASPSDLAALSLSEAAELLQVRKISSCELTQAVLARIDQLDGQIKAYVTVTHEHALAEAAAADSARASGAATGPLSGIPITLKDVINTAGLRTTSGSKTRATYVPNTDATVTTRLKQAGAVMVGKTLPHEFAWGAFTPPTRNPWNLAHNAAGSSGGTAAAIAADMCTAGIGSDTGGSIRMPAAATGIVGLKPTFGRVSKAGVTPLCWSLDHVGPLGKRVADLALLMNVIAGVDASDPMTVAVPVPDFTADLAKGVRGLRIGLPTNYFFEATDPEVARAVRTAITTLADQGAEIQEVTIPELALAVATWFTVAFPEASTYHQGTLRQQADAFQPDVRLFLELGEFYLATHYLKGQRARTMIKQAFRQAFRAIDVLIAPTLRIPAAKVDQQTTRIDGTEVPVVIAYAANTVPQNLTGLPTLALPCGFSSAGLPIGMQIIGKPFDESMVLRVGQAYEQATSWHTRKPPL